MSLYGALATTTARWRRVPRDSFGQPYDFRQAWIAKRGHAPSVALFRELPAGKPQHGEARPAYLPFPGTGRPSEPHTAGRTGDKIYGKDGVWRPAYIVYKHADTHNAHIHIVSVCVDGQGKKISDAYEHRRSMTACRELEADSACATGRTRKAESESGTKKGGRFLGGCPPSGRQYP